MVAGDYAASCDELGVAVGGWGRAWLRCNWRGDLAFLANGRNSGSRKYGFNLRGIE